jgi:hypothetical protein
MHSATKPDKVAYGKADLLQSRPLLVHKLREQGAWPAYIPETFIDAEKELPAFIGRYLQRVSTSFFILFFWFFFFCKLC